MSNRFHNKFHRHNHHTRPTDRNGKYPDSGYDPIASPESPFEGEFYVDGNVTTLSSISAVKTIYGSVLNITNNGVGPALKVTQSGAQPIAHFIDADGADIVFNNNGYAGFGTLTPNERLTVVGNISANGNINATGNIAAEKQFLAASGTISAPSIANDELFYLALQEDDVTPILDEDQDPLLTRGSVHNGINFPVDENAVSFITDGIEGVKITSTSDLSAKGNIFSDKAFLSKVGKFTNYEQNDYLLVDPATDGFKFVSNSIEQVIITSTGNLSAKGDVSADKQFLAAIGTVSTPSIAATNELTYLVLQEDGITPLIDEDQDALLTRSTTFFLVLQEDGITPLIDEDQNDLLAGGVAVNGINFPADENAISFITEGTEKARITSAGDLDVNGNVIADDLILSSATVQTFTNPATASGQFLVLNINGTNRAIRLWDFTN